jgi:hypothetical protein
MKKYTEKAFGDSEGFIRLEAYRALGFTEKALDDPHWEIRREAYNDLGFTEKALEDPDEWIRLDAKKYFDFLKETPLEDMPKHLDSGDRIIRIAAKKALER